MNDDYDDDRLPRWAACALIFSLCAGAWVAIVWAIRKCAGVE